jgi:putative Holliday junction resolvase
VTESKQCLGLDIGEKRIGVAISGPSGIVALPVKTITYNEMKEGIGAIREIIAERDIGCIVVGLPRSLNGKLGPQASKVQEFVAALAKSITIPIRFQDEQFSTVAVEKMMREAGTKSRKRAKRRDAEAAAYILQGYLDGRFQSAATTDSV